MSLTLIDSASFPMSVVRGLLHLARHVLTCIMTTQRCNVPLREVTQPVHPEFSLTKLFGLDHMNSRLD